MKRNIEWEKRVIPTIITNHVIVEWRWRDLNDKRFNEFGVLADKTEGYNVDDDGRMHYA